jgi:regulator of sirC expression with transglutaminase-like and TPR domain
VDEVEQFGALARADVVRMPLDVACLLVAGALDGGVDIAAEQARLDALAERVTGTTLVDVAHHLFRVEGFDGDRRHYYDPANSFLPRVLDRRVGIPISLAVLTIEVARRVGVPAVGVGMPGHFLVGDPADEDAFVDGFSGGVLLDRAAAQRLFAHLHGDDVAFEPSYLDPVPSVAIVARILANLRQIYATRGDRHQLVRVLELRCTMPGAAHGERAALAEALAATGRFDEAAEILESTAEAVPSATAARLRSSAQGLRARLN